nr:uncharacterized protein LOC111502931 [Leptinotarsa decemlineata]
MATGEYERIIKEEVESADDENVTNNSEERFDAHEIIPKKEFELKHIKVEDVIDIVHHDLKSEKCLGPQEVKECLHCGLCRGDLISPTDFFSPDSCNCQCKSESNVVKDEDIALDLKPLRFGPDSGNFLFDDQEETIVAKEEEVFNENMPVNSHGK